VSKARRKLLMGAAAATLLWPALAQAQAKVRHVGLLHVGHDHVPPSYQPMLDGMRELGYRDGVNIRFDFRNAVDEKAALEAARELVRQRVDLIVAFDQEACGLALQATKVIPIVIVHAANPVAGGFAKSLARPGGNMTGFAGRGLLVAKEMELLKELAPKLKSALLLFDSSDPSSLATREEARVAARSLAVALVERDVTHPDRLKAAFDTLKPKDAEVVLIASHVIRHRYQMAALQLATERGMAMVGARRDVVLAGALFTYSYDFAKVGRATASRYIDPILKGAKAGDLPIEEITDNRLVVNQRVMKRHGWTIPPALDARGAEFVE
jgi:putative ABC transport system substrate-binding protein